MRQRCALPEKEAASPQLGVLMYVEVQNFYAFRQHRQLRGTPMFVQLLSRQTSIIILIGEARLKLALDLAKLPFNRKKLEEA